MKPRSTRSAFLMLYMSCQEILVLFMKSLLGYIIFCKELRIIFSNKLCVLLKIEVRFIGYSNAICKQLQEIYHYLLYSFLLQSIHLPHSSLIIRVRTNHCIYWIMDLSRLPIINRVNGLYSHFGAVYTQIPQSSI